VAQAVRVVPVAAQADDQALAPVEGQVDKEALEGQAVARQVVSPEAPVGSEGARAHHKMTRFR